MLVFPELARHGMEREALRAAMPERVDFGQIGFVAEKRIVDRNGAIVAQAQHLAAVFLGVLRALLLLPLAHGQIQHAVLAESHPAAEVGR